MDEGLGAFANIASADGSLLDGFARRLENRPPGDGWSDGIPQKPAELVPESLHRETGSRLDGRL